MPDESKQENQQNPEESSTPNNSSDGASNEADASQSDANLPEWAQGKSREELAAMTQNVVQGVQQGQMGGQQAAQGVDPQQRAQYRQAQQQFQQRAAGQQPQQGPDPNDVFDNTEEWQRQLQQSTLNQVNQTIQQQAAPLLQSQAQTAKTLSKQEDDLREVWRQYGPEIEAMVQQLPLQSQANKETWDQAAKLVRGEHINELAQKRAEQMAQPAAGTESGRGATANAPSTSQDAIDEFWNSDDSYAELLKKRGVDKKQVRQMADQMNLSAEEYVEQVSNMDVAAGEDGTIVNKV